MGFVSLQRDDRRRIRGVEYGPHGRSARVYCVPKESTVNTIFAEIFIDARVVLLRIIVAGRVEVSVVKDWRATRDVIGDGCFTTGVSGEVLSAESIECRCRNACRGGRAGLVFRH